MDRHKSDTRLRLHSLGLVVIVPPDQDDRHPVVHNEVVHGKLAYLGEAHAGEQGDDGALSDPSARHSVRDGHTPPRHPPSPCRAVRRRWPANPIGRRETACPWREPAPRRAGCWTSDPCRRSLPRPRTGRSVRDCGDSRWRYRWPSEASPCGRQDRQPDGGSFRDSAWSRSMGPASGGP